MTAADYLREQSLRMTDRYESDCVTHACRLAELLRAEAKSPWIGRLRDRQERERGVFHGPLTPQRYAGRRGPTWTTHYVACADHDVYDPIVGTVINIDGYAQAVFGRDIAVERLLDPETTDRLLASGELHGVLNRGSTISPP